MLQFGIRGAASRQVIRNPLLYTEHTAILDVSQTRRPVDAREKASG